MNFSYNWLQDYLQKKLPAADKLAEVLMLHSFEVDELAKDNQDDILNVDILPNRSDCLSHYGLAREIAALTQNSLKDLAMAKLATSPGGLKNLNLKINCQQLVPRYSALVIEGIKIGPSPSWLKNKLTALSLRPINNIVDLTNFVMLEMGQPLHAFDYDKIKGQKMILRQAKKGEKVITLDGLKHQLEKGMLVAQDDEHLIDLVGIMGGQLSEIDQQTKNIVLQAAAFNQRNIYQTSKILGQQTDASAIYTQGTDLNLTKTALARAVYLLDQMGGGTIRQIIDVYPKKAQPKKIKLDLAKVNSLLGIQVPKAKVKSILQGLQLAVTTQGHKLAVTVPTFRQDLTLGQDLIEEIGRLYGYDKIKAQMPVAALLPPHLNDEVVYQNKIKDILIGFGFSEAYNYSFVGPQTIQACHLQAAELANPVSQEQKYLRPCLVPNLIKNVKDNLRYYDQISLFEIGKVFNLNQRQQIEETKNLAAVLVLGQKTNLPIGEAQEFYRLKGVVDSLFNKLAITDVWYDDAIEEKDQILNSFHPQRRAQIKVGNQLLGWLGEVNRRILNDHGIKEKIAILELDFDKLVTQATEERIYTSPSKYPALVRDIAILVEQDTKVTQVLNLINAAGGQLVADVDLFDIYQGQQLPAGKKNFAFHIIYQADKKTLTEKEVDKLHQKIINTLEQEGGWEVRK